MMAQSLDTVHTHTHGDITKKTNKQFAILSAIGILMVVSAHADSVLNLFADFFPYNSFFMPMFIFISGYFFRDKKIEFCEDIKIYIKKKTINLLLYYIIWNVIYGIIRAVLYCLKLDSHLVEINLYNLFVAPFINGQQFGLNGPSWFIPALFMVEIVFIGIRKFQIYCNKKFNYKIEFFTLILLMILNIYCVYATKYFSYSKFLIPFLRLGFFLFFFQLGKLYHDEIEKIENLIPTLLVILITIVINIVCIKLFKNINFIALYSMKGFKNLPSYIPVITSVSGIWFWLRISKVIVPLFDESRVLTKLSNNTKSIMMHHVFCMELLNIVFYFSKNIFHLDGFDIIKFKSLGGWYRYYGGTKQFAIVYIAVGIIGSLIIAKMEYFIKCHFNHEIVKNNLRK